MLPADLREFAARYQHADRASGCRRHSRKTDRLNAPQVLIVEDNALNRALLLAVLKPDGFELLMAENGLHGVEVAQRERPHLILMDVMLPGLNGYDATRRLKANPATRHIPIIAITSNAAPAERDRALDAGCDGYIAKPIDTRALPNRYGCFYIDSHAAPEELPRRQRAVRMCSP